MTGPRGLWLYAVAERAPTACLDQVTGVGGGQVRAVAAADLTAIAGDVRLEEFGAAALRRNLEDLAWLEETARAHHRVIDAIARRCPLVPMRLATVYSGEASLAAALTERRDDFRAALGRTSRRTEWGVKAYATRPAEPGPQPEPARGGQDDAGDAPGAAYLRRRRSELSAQQNARRDLMASVELIHARLSGVAAESRLHPPQAPQLTGTSAQMLLNAAYLLDEEQDDELTEAVAALAGQHPAVRLELTGPWPPYSFAGLAEGEDGLVVTARNPAKVAVPAGPERQPMHGRAFPAERIALVDLLDRVLAGGVVVAGEVTLSVADVDLVTVSLRALVTSVSALAAPPADAPERAR